MSKKISSLKNNYVPADILVTFLNDKLRNEREMKKLATAGKGKRKQISAAERTERNLLNKRNNLLNRRKVDIFDRHLFRSMASLTYFFEFLNKYPDLIVEFENEIEELFGFKGPHVKNEQKGDSKYIVFERFITAILNVKLIKNLDDEPAFRSYLINILQERLLTKIDMIGRMKETEVYENVILYDIARSRTWVKYLTRDIEPVSTGKPNRLANF